MPSHSQKGRPGKGGRGRAEAAGPTQRQLKAGELVRHALAEILREEPLHDPALLNASITVTEARVSPDLRHATVFVEPLGGRNAGEIVARYHGVAVYQTVIDAFDRRYVYSGVAPRRPSGAFDIKALGRAEFILPPGLVYRCEVAIKPTA